MVKLKPAILSILLLMILSLNIADTKTQNSCSVYKNSWLSKKYNYEEELSKTTLSESLNKVCSNSPCCDISMQNEMVAVSKLKLKALAESYLKDITLFLWNHSKNFNDYFLNNLEASKNELHQMFLNTYNKNYKLNQNFFFEFYNKLNQYMTGDLQNITKILETFFHEMVEKILNMMFISKEDAETIKCWTDNFMKLNPYQNTDHLIITSFQNTYPAARMLVNSMKAAQDVFHEFIDKKMMPSPKCAEDHAKAFHCSLCSKSDAMPCENLCRSIMSECFGSLNSKEKDKLSRSWKKLLMALKNLLKKLKHPFNFSEINKNLHVKLSDAIMNVHNYFPSVHKKLEDNCKSTRLRYRRSEDGNDSQYISSLPKILSGSSQKAADISPLVDILIDKIPEMIQHLQKYSDKICSSKVNLPKTEKPCWDGLKETPKTPSKKGQPKDIKQNKALTIDPFVKDSIIKLNKIATTINDLLNNKNKDPVAYKVKNTKPLRKVDIPRVRSFRISEKNIEGSGNSNTDAENDKVKPKIKPEVVQPFVVTKKPIEIIEGSGNSNVPTDINSAKKHPSFPEIPNKKQDPIPPKRPIQNPTITDDEDLTLNQNENEKPRVKEISNENKPIVEGSGSVEKEKSTKPVIVSTTTTTTLAPITEPKKPEKDVNNPGRELSIPEGSGQSVDEETTSHKPQISHSRTSINLFSGTTISLIKGNTNFSVLLPHELPGEIPNEIWIPRIVDYDSNGKMITNDKSKAHRVVNVVSTALSLSITLISISIYGLL